MRIKENKYSRSLFKNSSYYAFVIKHSCYHKTRPAFWNPPLIPPHWNWTSDVKYREVKRIILDTIKQNFPSSQGFTALYLWSCGQVEEENLIHELFEELRAAAALFLRVNHDMDWFKPETNQMQPQQLWITWSISGSRFLAIRLQ